MPTARLAFALVVYLLVGGAVLTANAWDPLGGALGAVVLAAASVALGLLLASWWAVLLGAPLTVIVVIVTAPDDPLAPLGGLIVGATAAIAIAVGVAVAKLATRRVERAWPRALGAAGMAAAGVATVGGLALELREFDDTPAAPVLLDERSGTYRGLRVGMPLEQARSMLGPGVDGDPGLSPAPLGEDHGDISGPSAMPGYRYLRYPSLVVMHERRKVSGYITTAGDAETRAGVGVGDSLSIAEKRYRPLDCDDVTFGDSTIPSYRACEGRLPSGPVIWFGGDPIDSIWVFSESEFERDLPPLGVNP